ncbi:hypothetical protein TPY_1660 [Sulfobacillus acidophilus TPY]|uniref:Uncharacterized protein n=1 Tax=Sulfobacillus acidophilus (strain ATCC 700253 / DSM 10332 / NAL) TaxID=679936 RepID=G8U0Q0_SULAD|nr:hypothetical protein TPY_1660 [Sulfobacillus acidophilus TPY]AEW05353.1 hypothetical protein Sulac_1860 [Sulfobacillus acidophilus DSM 10332]
MKLSVKQLIVVFVTMLATFALLRGAQWVYLTTAVKSPLVQTMGSIPGVERVSLTPNGEVTVVLNPSADLMTVYRQVEVVATQTLGHTPTGISMVNHANPALVQLANNVRFEVAQGEATGQYVAMKNQIQAMAAQSHSQATVELGNTHLYITLRQGSHVLYDVIPIVLGGGQHG